MCLVSISNLILIILLLYVLFQKKTLLFVFFAQIGGYGLAEEWEYGFESGDPNVFYQHTLHSFGQ